MFIKFLYKSLQTRLSLLLFIYLLNSDTICIIFSKLIQRFRECHKQSHTRIFNGYFLLLTIKIRVAKFILCYFGELK